MRLAVQGFVCIVLAATTAATAGDWAHWRGPEHVGISREKNLIEDWSPDGKNVLWKSDIGGRATPIVMDGRVYLNCRTGHDIANPDEKIHAGEQVVCWDTETGDVLWRDRFNVFQTDIPAQRVGWASMCGDPETGNVYMHSVDGLFRCYSADGEVLWEYSLFEDFGKISGYGGRTMSPIIDEDRVIVGFLAMNWGETAPPPPEQFYYAFDKRTGELQWVSAPGGPPHDTIYSVPVVKVINGQRMLIGGNADGGVYAINARTGEPIWGFRMSKRGINVSPVTDGKYVYVSHGEDNIDTTEFGRIQCIDATGQGDVTETHSVWRIDSIKAGYSSPVVKDGILYVVADTGNLYAFDSKTGERLWKQNLGTVGKGSPVWADGKLYVMEVNGNVHILEPSRGECQSLSHVQLQATEGKGYDEIYASPAISNGRIFLVTRDRTLCLSNEDRQPASDPIPKLPQEKPAGEQIDLLQLVPYETTLWAGESIDYKLKAFDKNGRLIKTMDPELTTELAGVETDGATLQAAEELEDNYAGTITASVGDLTAEARVRVFAELPWQWDFEELTGKDVPPTWIGAFPALQPKKVDDSTVLRDKAGKGRPSDYFWLGPADMSGYTIQADVMAREQRRRIPNVGITAQRYNLILEGNTATLEIQSWAPHRRMAKEIPLRWDPDTWYTMKMRVDIQDDGAHVKGKVWPRDEQEPAEWTIEAVDPHPNRQGSPGLYVYQLSESYFDNVIVTKGQQ